MSRTQRDLKAMRQAQREEALRRQRARDRRNLLIVVGAIAALAIAILVVALYLNANAPHHLTFQTVTHPENVGQVVADEGRSHVPAGTQVPYKHQPPTSGPHYPQPDAPVAWQYSGGPLQPEVWVHNLEHGGIVILYNCPNGCDDLQQKLKSYVNDIVPAEPTFGEYKVIMTPYSEGMGTHKVAVLAWDWIEFMDDYDQAKLTEFYEAHVDQGPERIP